MCKQGRRTNMVLQLNEWVKLMLRNELNCRWLMFGIAGMELCGSMALYFAEEISGAGCQGQEATASVDDVAEQEIVMDSIASSQIFTMSFGEKKKHFWLQS